MRPVGVHVAAVLPAYNVEQEIGGVLRALPSLFTTIIVVDDGSSDETAERARAAGAEVLSLARNLGKGHAVRAGLASIFEREFSHVLMLDADMQHLPSEAPRLLEVAARSGADVVIGERQFRRSEMPASRYHANRIGSRALSAFVGVPVADTQCGFRVYVVDALRSLSLGATGYEVETEMLIKVRRRGGSIASAPVTAVYVGQRSKLRPIRDTTRTCFLAVYYRFVERV